MAPNARLVALDERQYYQEGIRADLEWMKRVGIGGFQNFDAGLSTPQIVDKRLVYMTPEWKDAFRFTATLADKLGLEMAIAGSPGWSESGGPWVTPAQAMKKYVWSETQVEGGAIHWQATKTAVHGGTYQNRADRKWPVEFYADSAVVAYRTAKVEPVSARSPQAAARSTWPRCRMAIAGTPLCCRPPRWAKRRGFSLNSLVPNYSRRDARNCGPGRHYAHDPNRAAHRGQR
jgi:hypothetical protein